MVSVLRGGSWNNNPRNLRSANRNRNDSGNRNNNNGFRVASTLRCPSRCGKNRVGCARVRPRPAMMSTVGESPIKDGARLAPFTEGGRCFVRES